MRVTPDVAIEHGAGDAAGAGLLHPVGDVQEVRIVLGVGGVVRGPGQCARLVTVGRAASALSVLVISGKKCIISMLKYIDNTINTYNANATFYFP